MSSLLYPSSCIRSDGVLTIKQYGDKYKVVWNKSIRKKGFEDIIEPELEMNWFDGKMAKPVQEFIKKDIAKQKLDNNISRARSKVHEYAYCNNWDYFVTLTISPEKYDRYNLPAYIKDLGKWLSNYYTHHGSKISYLFVPEMHKDGAWHIHGLISGILPKHLTQNQHGYLDFPMYSKKFGFCNLSTIKSHAAVSGYITKYFTKNIGAAPYGQRSYYCSKGLKKAELIYRFENIDPNCLEWDFVHDEGYCMVSMVDNLDFMENICITN